VISLWVVWRRGKKRQQFVAAHQSMSAIQRLNWNQFENLVAAAYRQQGYRVTMTKGGADGGIDLWLSRSGEQIAVQCKHWRSSRVGVQPVRELLGIVAAERATCGIFVASSGYTRDALRFAKNRDVILLDGIALEELLQSVNRSNAG